MTDEIEFRSVEVTDNFTNDTVNTAAIIINGRDFLELIHNNYCDGEEAFQYLTPDELYIELSEALTKGSYSYKYGAYLCCCASCREPGCQSIHAKITEDGDCIIWSNFQREHRTDILDLEYRFEKEGYWRKVKELQDMI